MPAAVQKFHEVQEKIKITANKESSLTKHYDFTFERTEGEATDKGMKYEDKLASLLYLRATVRDKKFYLGTAVKEAGKFDDIVFSYNNGTINKTVFLQLKHKENPEGKNSKKEFDNFFLVTKKKNPFSLKEYFHSFCKIKLMCQVSRAPKWWGEFKNFQFVLFSNVIYESEYLKPVAICENDILDTGGCVYRLNEEVKNILKNDNTVENDTIIQEFLQKFHLYINQKSEKGISVIIKKEILKNYKMSFHKASDIKKSIVNEFRNLRYKKDNYPVISEKYHIYSKECGQDIISDINNKELNGNVNIQLEDGVAKRFKENLGNSKCNVSVIQNTAPVWCSLLAHKTLTDFGDHPVIVRLKKLREEEIVKQISKVWPSDWCKYLILVVTNDDKDVSHSKMTNFIKNSTDECKLVLVTNSLKTLNLEKDGYDSFELLCDFRNLTDESKETILQKFINFQGNFPVKLKDILQVDEAENILDSLSLNELVLHPGTFQIGDTIPQMNYIGRKVVHYGYISTNVLQEQCNGIFAVNNALGHSLFLNNKQNEIPFCIPLAVTTFTEVNAETTKFQRNIQATTNLKSEEGVDKNLHSSFFAKSQRIETSTSTRNTRENVHFITGRQDYELLCKKGKNVHWLEAMSGNLLKWKATSDDISVIQKHILRTAYVCDVYNVSTVYDVPGKTVLLISEAGMGKTSLLKELAYNTKVRNRSTFVIHLKLLNSILFLKNLEKDKLKMDNIDEDVIVNFLLSSCQSDCVIWRSLCHNAFLKEKKIVLLIDGFDEIIPMYEDIVSNILTKIVKMNIDKIWITSRPNVKDSLERKLKTLSYALNPFEQIDQIEFFHKQWRDKEFDKNTIMSCVTRMSTLDNTFLRIPLHCEIVAEVFQTCMKIQDINQSNLLTKVTDELYLYEAFIRRKFQEYCKKYSLYKSDPEISTIIENWDEYVTNHMHAAVLHICINNDKICERLMKSTNVASFLEKIENGKEKTGLISFVQNGTLQFVHRKFAEFFTAKYFSQTLSQNINMVRDIMLSANSHSFSFDLEHMLNLTLFKDLPLHRAVYNRDVVKVKELLNMDDAYHIKAVDQLGRTALHIALNKNHSVDLINIANCNEIIEELLKCKPDVNAQDILTQRTPFQYLGPSSSWYVIEMLLNTNSVQGEHIVELIQLLWQTEKSKNRIIGGVIYGVTCESETVLKFVFNCYKPENMEDVWVSMQYEALYRAICNLKINILKYMINVLKIDKNMKDTQGNIILHDACLKGDTETLQYLVEECELDMNLRNIIDHSPVDNAVLKGHVHILKWFCEERKLNIKDQVDKKGKGVLFWARDINCVQYLVEECGIDPKVCKDVSGALPIHEASRLHLWKIVDYYVEKCGVDINVMNNSFATVLNFACLNHRQDRDITDFLIKYRERLGFKKRNIHKMDPFCVAVMNGNFIVAKCIANVYDVTAQDEKGNTCLQHIVLNHPFIDLIRVKFLVEDCKVDPNIRNNDGKTALDLALEKNAKNNFIIDHSEVISYLKTLKNRIDDFKIVNFF